MHQLEIRQISKSYAQSRSSQVEVLKAIDISVDPGELLVLLGASGSGKTTLLKCIAGLTSPTAGFIGVGGRTLVDTDRRIDLPPHKRGLGMVFQNFALWPHMTVRKNVAFPLNTSPSDEKVAAALTLVECLELADYIPAMLSGGQQQRVALARALVAEPTVILFDEPLSSLDVLLRGRLRTQLGEIHRATGFTGVYVTHDQAEALSLGTRVALIRDGSIEQIGTPEQLYFNPATEYVAEFLGSSNRIALSFAATHWKRADSQELVDWDPEQQTFGQRAILRFRPENLLLREEGDVSLSHRGGMIHLGHGRVANRVFLGESVEYAVRSGGLTLRSRRGAMEPGLDVGSMVDLCVDSSRVSAYPEAADGEPPADSPIEDLSSLTGPI